MTAVNPSGEERSAPAGETRRSAEGEKEGEEGVMGGMHGATE